MELQNQNFANNKPINHQQKYEKSENIQTPMKITDKINRQSVYARSLSRSKRCITISEHKRQQIYQGQYFNHNQQSKIINPQKSVENAKRAQFKYLYKSPQQQKLNYQQQNKNIDLTQDLMQLQHFIEIFERDQYEEKKLEQRNLQLKKKLQQRKNLEQIGKQLRNKLMFKWKDFHQQHDITQRNHKILKQKHHQFLFQSQIKIYEMNQEIYQEGKKTQLLQLENIAQKDKGAIITQKLQSQINKRIKLSQQLEKLIQQYKTQENLTIQSEKALDQAKFKNFILKTQLNTKFKASFNVSTQNIDHTLGLSKQYQIWDFKKNPSKKTDLKYIAYFIILQLYPKWQKILKKAPYTCNTYKIMFGQQKGDLKHLLKLLTKNPNQRQSTKVIKRQIALGAPHYEYYQKALKALTNYLKNFQSQHMKIIYLNLESKQNYQQLQIRYILLGQQKMQIFEFHRLKQFSKQQLSKFLFSKEEKTSCAAIQIPLYLPLAQSQKYKVIYDYLKSLC